MKPSGRTHAHHGRRYRELRSGDRAHNDDLRSLLLAALVQGAGQAYRLMRQQLASGVTAASRSFGELTAGSDQEQARQLASREEMGQLTGADRPAESAYQELGAVVRQLQLAAGHVAAAGTSAQADQAVTIIRGSCQAVYQLLADQ